MKALRDFPRVDLAHKPTPLESLPTITELLEGPRIWVKRDDCTGLGMGGNKARQLEYYLGEAMAQESTTVIITGAVQSNYVRMAAAAAAKLGLACEIQLEDRVPATGEDYLQSGNVLLDRLFGARIHTYPEGEDEAGADAALEEIAERVRGEGGTPYVVHLGAGHRPLGALGYVEAATEIAAQSARLQVDFDAVVVPSGSGSTHAGLLVGFRRLVGAEVAVHGVCVRRDAASQATRLLDTAAAIEAELEVSASGDASSIGESDVMAHDTWLAPGYGRPSEAVSDAIALAARNEGLLLDPVYSGKAFAGLVGLVRDGVFAGADNVLFVHTGGTPALFGYRTMLTELLGE